MSDFVSTSIIDIDAPAESVWFALTDLPTFSQVMFGSEVVTSWEIGSPILFRGEWEGKPFEDKGEVLESDKPSVLRTTHFSPMSGEPDVPENYHEVAYRLEPIPTGTRVTLTQDNNPTEEAARHSNENWAMALKNLKAEAEAL
jgi:uncharacterized protein YndB with AHSA1/START domain